MSKTSDIVEPVIGRLLLDISYIVMENNTLPNIPTMKEPNETIMSGLDVYQDLALSILVSYHP